MRWRRTQRKGRALIALVALLAGVLIAACGSSSSSSSDGGSQTLAAAHNGANKSPITIGSVNDITGPLGASKGGDNRTLQAWADYTNAHGGINGHPVKLVALDDQSNPTASLAAAKKLVQQDHIVAMVGAMTDFYQPWQQYLDAQGIPVVGSDPFNDPMTTDPDHLWFPQGTTNDAMYYNELKTGKAQGGGSKMAIFYCAEAPACAAAVPLITKLGAKQGVNVVYSAKIAVNAPSYTAPCLAAKQAGATMLDIGDTSQVVQRVMNDCHAQGYHPQLVSIGPTVSNAWTSSAGTQGAQVTENDVPFSDTSNPGIRTMQAALNKYAPGLVSSPLYGEETVYAWAAGQLFKEAAEAAHSDNLTSSQLVKGLYSLHNTTLGGIAPALTFKQGGPHEVSCSFKLSVQDKRFVTGSGAVCAPPGV
jgi:branched-chain amino acid transport system substrate-binding protein